MALAPSLCSEPLSSMLTALGSSIVSLRCDELGGGAAACMQCTPPTHAPLRVPTMGLLLLRLRRGCRRPGLRLIKSNLEPVILQEFGSWTPPPKFASPAAGVRVCGHSACGSLLFADRRARAVAHLWQLQLPLKQLGIRSSTTSAAA